MTSNSRSFHAIDVVLLGVATCKKVSHRRFCGDDKDPSQGLRGKGTGQVNDVVPSHIQLSRRGEQLMHLPQDMLRDRLITLFNKWISVSAPAATTTPALTIEATWAG